ncbi:MAG: hypothetical protein SF339_13690 [Blastocatellia bacterium]|nr:hypothetical protein [Blastocatellia bacterium]
MNAADERNVIQLPVSDAHPTAAPAQPAAPADLMNQGNLDKVRDIIFGGQMREYERRFAKLEERIQKEAADAREDSRRRFDSLENFIKQEIAALGDRLRSENQQRSQAAEEITRELRDTARSLTQKLNQLDEHASATHREIRQQILDQSKALSEEIRQKQDEITAALAREARDLRHDKTDRAALANLFTELALRLNNDFKIPGDE